MHLNVEASNLSTGHKYTHFSTLVTKLKFSDGRKDKGKYKCLSPLLRVGDKKHYTKKKEKKEDKPCNYHLLWHHNHRRMSQT